jgi:hypothetical protein
MAKKVFKTGVTTTSTTLTNMGEIGEERWEGGKKYRLVYTVASKTDKAILALDSTDSALASYTVQYVPASTSPVFGVNDTGGPIPALTYFWCMVEGPHVTNSGFLDSDAAIATESLLMLNSDKRWSQITTVTSLADRPEVGQAILAITSVPSTQGTPTIWVKGMG